MTKNIKYYPSLNEFIQHEYDSEKKYVFYVASETCFDLEQLIQTQLEFVGAIFPQIIYNNKSYDKGIVVLELIENMQMEFIPSIKEHSFEQNEFDNYKSIICIVEGLSIFNEPFLEKLFASVDINTNIIGGGAGLLRNSANGVLFNTQGYFSDSAILIKIKNDISIGVQHGCQVLSGPYVATQCDGTTLKQIDYKNAFEVYKQAIYEDCNQELTQENFYDLSKLYPLGIVKYNSEQIARDPIRIENGELVLVGTIKENSVLNILKADKKALIDASKKAAKTAISEESNMVIVFDCMARVEYLQEQFEKELENIAAENNKESTFGAITIGEIANSGNRYISFYNYTCVVGALCN